ncbi:MAG TPA: 2-dehydro-3-deoxy-6-phosphogalactonate aldolase [Burkholderiaceae bacterium]|nr:2-dehydro-3-deoxy-6-phosphogalactonate aldolase [Burkholderiaceae bacterium]
MKQETLRRHFHEALESAGLVAILRGIEPDEVVDVGGVLYEAGFRIIEVPLNSPQPLRSIERLAASLPADTLVGAGTVLAARQVGEVLSAGGRLVVMPHSDNGIIRAAIDAGMAVLPGVATPTEAFAALGAGAIALKAFPAELLTPTVLKAWRAVLPADVPLVPVGGITPDNMQAYLDVGAAGFGLGSALYRAGDTAAAVRPRAQAFMARWRQATARSTG